MYLCLCVSASPSLWFSGGVLNDQYSSASDVHREKIALHLHGCYIGTDSRPCNSRMATTTPDSTPSTTTPFTSCLSLGSTKIQCMAESPLFSLFFFKPSSFCTRLCSSRSDFCSAAFSRSGYPCTASDVFSKGVLVDSFA